MAMNGTNNSTYHQRAGRARSDVERVFTEIQPIKKFYGLKDARVRHAGCAFYWARSARKRANSSHAMQNASGTRKSSMAMGEVNAKPALTVGSRAPSSK